MSAIKVGEGRPGLVIAGRYELVSLIGRGGMGAVWRAQHRTLKTPVAIKLLTTAKDGEEHGARFLREARAAAQLRGINVVSIFDFGVDDGVAFIAMEQLDGQSLRNRLADAGRLDAAETAQIFAGVLRAVSRAHSAGIVHRDLKPDNVFLARDADATRVIPKVLDFGIASLVEPGSEQAATPTADDQDPTTKSGAVLGTPYYMSPEQIRGRKDVDARTDLWALAVIAFECLLGRRPFVADSIGDLVMKICAEPIVRPSNIGAARTHADRESRDHRAT